MPWASMMICCILGQITRVYKGKEHAEMEFTVSYLLYLIFYIITMYLTCCGFCM